MLTLPPVVTGLGAGAEPLDKQRTSHPARLAPKSPSNTSVLVFISPPLHLDLAILWQGSQRRVDSDMRRRQGTLHKAMPPTKMTLGRNQVVAVSFGGVSDL